MIAGTGSDGPALADVRGEFPGWAIASCPRPAGGCVAIRLCPHSDPVPQRHAVIEADSPAELAQGIRAAERAITRERGQAARPEALEARYQAAPGGSPRGADSVAGTAP